MREPHAATPFSWMFIVQTHRKSLFVGFLLVLMNRALGLSMPASMRYLVDEVLQRHNEALLLPLFGALIVATGLQAATTYGIRSIVLLPAEKFIAEVRETLHTHLGTLAISYVDMHKAGSIASILMNDVERLRCFLGSEFVDVCGGLITCLVAVCVLAHTSVFLTCLTIVLISLSALAVHFKLKRVRPLYSRRSELQGDVTAAVTEYLQGMRVIKTYGAEAGSSRQFSESGRKLADCTTKIVAMTSEANVAARSLLFVAAAIIMYAGSREVVRAHITIGQFVTFTVFLVFLIGPLLQFLQIGSKMSEALAGLARIREILRERPEDSCSKRLVTLERIRGRIEFERVSFSYLTGPSVLRDISFTAEPGTVNAIVGVSGSGKSTLMSLIGSFYSAQQGRVLVDGVDMAETYLDTYRRQLGIVFQETFLFNGTVRDNIMLARPAAGEDELLQVCRIAQVSDFVERLDQKYDTFVGERGTKLSGGQRQRVAIARALLANPAILLLDEATSNLDAPSEAEIQSSLCRLSQNRTTFVITHHLSTIRNADQILVMDNGRIVERGRHEDLYHPGTHYFALVNGDHMGGVARVGPCHMDNPPRALGLSLQDEMISAGALQEA